jgi:superfamily II DNA/RNA helicase
LAAQGITTAFPIQAMTLPLALTGADLIGQAKTGTGKTLAFGIPILQRVVGPQDAGFAQLKPEQQGAPQALVVVPTRELAIQVSKDIETAGKVRGIRVLTVYGGRSYEPQVAALEAGIEVVVGTPGRLLDLHKQRHLILSNVTALVLDEADEMLDMGFLPDVERLVAATSPVRQTMLFSATMPGQIVGLARRYMTQPTHIRATDPSSDSSTVDAIEQHVWRAHPMDKVELLSRILQADGRGLSIVFTKTKRAAARVADDLTARGFAAGAVHGDLGQGAREQALRAFRNGKVDVLVATDVAARGIDIEGVTHVINYECPEDENAYLHRVGRTGRAGASGVAVTFVDWADITRWQNINKMLGLAFKEPIETYSNSDHVYTGLKIPTTATGTLPKSERTRAGLGAEELEDLGETGARARKGGAGASGSRGGSRSGGSTGGSGNRGSRSGSTRSTSPTPESVETSRAPRSEPRRPRQRTRRTGEGDNS